MSESLYVQRVTEAEQSQALSHKNVDLVMDLECKASGRECSS